MTREELFKEVRARARGETWRDRRGYELLFIGLRLGLYGLGAALFFIDDLLVKALAVLVMSYAYFGIVITGTHEARHNSLVDSARGNRLLGYLFADALTGQSADWWHQRHVKEHHLWTNIREHDPPLYIFPWMNRYVYFFVVPWVIQLWLLVNSFQFERARGGLLRWSSLFVAGYVLQAWPLALGLVLLTALWALPGVARTPRWVGSAALLLMAMTLTPPNITTGTLQVRVNDVGQGQLLELRTANHRLLYDTGPRFRSGFMPLETLWPPGQAFDAVIVSHSDRDHAGGMAALRELHDVGRWYSPGVVGLGVDDRACRAGSRWRWDGVEFRFLGPPAGADLAGRESNDRSCVLLVEAGDQRLLVSGDASAEVERRLAEALPGPVSVLVAGHHGSRSSSSPLTPGWSSFRSFVQPN